MISASKLLEIKPKLVFGEDQISLEGNLNTVVFHDLVIEKLHVQHEDCECVITPSCELSGSDYKAFGYLINQFYQQRMDLLKLKKISQKPETLKNYQSMSITFYPWGDSEDEKEDDKQSLSYKNLFDGDSIIEISEKGNTKNSFKQLMIDSALVRPSDMELLEGHKISCTVKMIESGEWMSFKATNIVVHNFKHKHMPNEVKIFDPAWLQH